MSSPSSYNFGACPNPGITYDSSQLSFAPSNTDAFPIYSSSDIASLESAICDRLREDGCSASPAAIAACDRARWLFSGYAGQQAAEAWNEALGVDGVGSGGVAAPTLTDDAYAFDASSSSVVVVVLSTSMIRSDSSSTSSRTLFSEASSSSSSSSPSLTSISTPTNPQPMTTAQSTTPASSSSTRSQTSSSIPATTSEFSNGSPFDPQIGSSPPRNPRKTVLTLMTVFLLLLAPLII